MLSEKIHGPAEEIAPGPEIRGAPLRVTREGAGQAGTEGGWTMGIPVPIHMSQTLDLWQVCDFIPYPYPQ